MATIANLTMEQLQQLIDQRIDERLTKLLGAFEIADEDDKDKNLTWDKVRAFVEQHRWTPPPGGKSGYEMLREDRDCRSSSS